jgi:hypothetical protein
MTKFVHHARKVARDATAGPMDLQMAIDHHVMAVLHATVIVHHVTEIVHHVTANAHRVTVSDLPDLQRRSVLSKTLCDLMPTKTESSTKQS